MIVTDINLVNFSINLLRVLQKDNMEVKVIVQDITNNKNIISEHFLEKRPSIEKEAWENLIIWLEIKGKKFSMDIKGNMNGAILVEKDFLEIGCSVYGLSLIENVFCAMKILEFYQHIEFEKILQSLERANAPLDTEKILVMNAITMNVLAKK